MGKALASFLGTLLLVAVCDSPLLAQRGGHGGGVRAGGGVRIGGFIGGGTRAGFGGHVAVGGFRGGIGVVGGGVRFAPRFPHRVIPPRVIFFSPYVYSYPYYSYYPTYPLYSSYSTITPYNSYDQAPVYVNSAPQQPMVIMVQPSSNPAPAPVAKQIILLAFKNHSIYAVTDYSVENGRLTYTTDYGASNTVDLDQLDLEFSRRLNRERNVPFPINDR